jgi:CheY-like chemotaxis protein
MIQFYSGTETIDYLKEKEELEVDLIFIDYNMPFMNGLEAAQIIKEILIEKK